MSSFVQGPWMVMPVNNGERLYVVAERQDLETGWQDEICEVVMDYPDGMADAHSKILAASPGLLAFVQECAADDLDRVSPGMKEKARTLLQSHKLNGLN